MSEKNNKMQLNFTSLVNNTREIPSFEVVKAKKGSYMKWGNDNLFPQYLYDLYTHSSQFSAIVNTMVKYIEGNGIINKTSFNIVNRKGDSFEDFIEKLIYDYIIFGGFAFQVTRNKAGKISELNWLDFRYIRVDEDELTIFYNKTWDNGRSTYISYERFNPTENQSTSIFYYKGRLTRNQYPIPSYISALTALEISTQIPEYHLNNLTNGFHPSAVINFNNGDGLSDDVMDEIEERIKEKFQGTQNASKILLSFNADKEHSTTIERLSDEGNVDIYNSLAESVKSDIFIAFRINKLLLGNAEDNTGFNKEAYLESFAIYNKTVIQPIQREFVCVIERILGEDSIEFKPFVLNWGDEVENTSEKID